MKPSVEYIQHCFDTFNRQYFDNSLSPLPIKLSHAKGFLGKVTFVRKRQGLFRGYKNEDFVLRINVRIDLPEEIVQDTILHEMIHYHIAVNQLQDTSAHGRLFRAQMARINQEGNRHISITHRLNEEQKAQAHIHKERAVAIVHFSDGKTGVKVVPKQEKHIRYWHKMAMRRFAIDRIDWYLSDDPYFAQFPSSIAMKIFLIQKPEDLPLTQMTMFFP